MLNIIIIPKLMSVMIFTYSCTFLHKASIMDSKVDQFRAVTGAPIDVAKSILEACGGNLELAVNMHMEGGGPSSSPMATPGPGPSRQPDKDLVPTSDELLSPTSYEAKSVSQSFTVYVLAIKQQLNIVAVLVRPMSCILFIPILLSLFHTDMVYVLPFPSQVVC